MQAIINNDQRSLKYGKYTGINIGHLIISLFCVYEIKLFVLKEKIMFLLKEGLFYFQTHLIYGNPHSRIHLDLTS